jgi:hypothetical protein
MQRKLQRAKPFYPDEIRSIVTRFRDFRTGFSNPKLQPWPQLQEKYSERVPARPTGTT